jgi:hypothetical protein
MAVDRLVTDDSARPDREQSSFWAVPAALLLGIWLWLVFSSGGYPTKNWVFPVMTLGVLGLAAASLLAYPRRPRQLSLTILGLAAAYSVWVAASSIWATDSGAAWPAAGRTFAYLLVMALGMAYFTSASVRATFQYLLMLAAMVLLAVAIWRLWSASELNALFSDGRLTYPAGRADAAAAVFLIPFWPLMWLAAGPYERAPVRGIAVGLATGLLGLAFMTQSRGAAWSLAITLVLVFILSPGRVRMLFYLVVPALLLVYAFPRLDQYRTLTPQALGGGIAARTLFVAVIAAGFMGTILALLEGWVKVSARMKVIFGAVLLAGCAAAIVYGAIGFAQSSGHPLNWLGDNWQRLMSEPAAGDQSSSPGPAGTAGGAPLTRAEAWNTAWREFLGARVAGVGADDSVDHPRSLALQVLADTGIVGAVLFAGALLLAIGGMLWPRLAVGWGQAKSAWRGKDEGPPGKGATTRDGTKGSRWGQKPMVYGWQMALFAGAAYWFVQANIDWLWRIPGVTIPALLLVTAGVAATDARAGTLWPRVERRLRHTTSYKISGAKSAAHTVEGATGDGTPDHASWTRRFPRGRLEPAGLLSQAFRIGLLVFSAAAIIFAASAYLLASL